jgi:hypothetical protein
MIKYFSFSFDSILLSSPILSFLSTDAVFCFLSFFVSVFADGLYIAGELELALEK